jgi:PPOX class probable F420-dependent enzyme
MAVTDADPQDIPAQFHDLFDEANFATFATIMPAGTPQQTIVWIDREVREGPDYLLVNTEAGRQKHRNVQRNPRVGVAVMDPEDPYRYVSVRGRVAEVTKEGAEAHADRLAREYMDVEEYPSRDQEEGDRVIIRIEPLRVTGTDQA